MKIIIQCTACNGTGLYSGFAERKGEAVICLSCKGQGWQNLSYIEYTGRKKKPGIKTVSESAGTFIATGIGPVGRAMTYDEFEQAVPVKAPT
jgi:hypothetical protein